MTSFTYLERRTRLKTYFDRTAVEAWARLTTDAPVSGIRATVRRGREEMRATLMGWLPANMAGLTLLDAGCGTGLLAIDAARRGAAVTAVDLSPTLVDIARERTPADLGVDQGASGQGEGSIAYHAGDMLDPPGSGHFAYTVAMDSLIHYRASDIVGALARLAARTDCAIAFTIAPRTAALTVMHTVGKAFPKGDRSPEIEPVSHAHLGRLIAREPRLTGWRITRSARIARGFYISQALLLQRASPADAALPEGGAS